MIQLTDHGMYLVNGVPQETAATDREEARRRTMAWQILQAHNESPDPMQLLNYLSEVKSEAKRVLGRQ